MSDVVVLRDTDLSIEEFIDVVRYGKQLEFSPEFCARVEKSHAFVQKSIDEGRTVYGVNTGFGDNVVFKVSPEETATLQKNIIRSHATAVGKPLSAEEVRAIQMIMITNTGRGLSGISLDPLETLRQMLNKGVVSYAPGEGCVESLCVEGHIALNLIGEGKAYYQGELLPAAEAMKRAGIPTITLKAKEGLSMLNGTTANIALSVVTIYRAMELAKHYDILAAFAFETLQGTVKALDPRLLSAKKHVEQQEIGRNILRILEGSEITKANEDRRVQDCYILRRAAQMGGAAKRTINEGIISVWEELNSCSDNPIFFPDGDEATPLMGANFCGAYDSLHMDSLVNALTQFAKFSERHVERLTNRHYSDYPAFLVKNPGLNSGFMILQYTAASLLNEMKVLATPSSVDSIPTSGGQEDPVLFAYYAAKKAFDCCKKMAYIYAIDYLAELQALDFIDGLKSAPALQKVYDLIRSKVPTVDEDRFYGDDIEAICAMIEDGSIVAAVESVTGPLEHCHGKF